MNEQFKRFLNQMAANERQKHEIPRLKVLRRLEYNNNIRSGGSTSAIGIASTKTCPNEVATSIKSLSRMMGVNIK